VEDWFVGGVELGMGLSLDGDEVCGLSPRVLPGKAVERRRGLMLAPDRDVAVCVGERLGCGRRRRVAFPCVHRACLWVGEVKLWEARSVKRARLWLAPV